MTLLFDYFLMKKVALELIATIALTSPAVTGQVVLGLLGDSVSVAHYFPDLSTVWSDGGFVVVPGTVTLGAGEPHYTVDLQDTSISVDFLIGAAWIPSSFDGLVVSEIDQSLTGVSVDTNLAGWDDGRLTFDAHSVSANWGGLAFDTSSYFDLSLSFETIPEPPVLHAGLVFAALGLAMAGLTRARRKV